jgi:glycosyltransferase involved in cell wall biosynthesis
LIRYYTAPVSALRILHVVPYYEHAWAYGGIPRLAATMTRGLAARGHQVTVCTTDVCDNRSRLHAVHPSAGIDVRVFRNVSNRLAYHYQFFTPLGLNRFLRGRVNDFDVAHLHACRNLPGEIAARALSRHHVPYVVSPNGTAPRLERRFLAKRVFDLVAGRRMLERSSLVLAVSEAERRQLLGIGVAAHRIHVLPNPIDESEYQRDIVPSRFYRTHGLPSRPIVLFLGKLTPRKGVDVLLHAFQHIDHAHLVIAGNDMGAGADMHRLIAELNLGRRVSYVGLLTGAHRLDALAAATVVVYPSRDEVFGLAAVEALMCGTPVVVCDDSGCGEIIAEIGGGLRVPYGGAIQLATAIKSVLESSSIWRQRAQAVTALVAERFGSMRVCAELESVYREAVRAA